MVHSRKIRPGKCPLIKAFMVAALGFSALASHSEHDIIKSVDTFSMRKFLTVNAQDASRVSSKLVTMNLMNGAGCTCEQC